MCSLRLEVRLRGFVSLSGTDSLVGLGGESSTTLTEGGAQGTLCCAVYTKRQDNDSDNDREENRDSLLQAS